MVVSDNPVFCRTAGFRIMLRGMRPLASQTTRNQSQRCGAMSAGNRWKPPKARLWEDFA
jgi:hypothetical protein